MFSLTIKSRQFGSLGRAQAKFTYFYTLTHNSITLKSVSLAIWVLVYKLSGCEFHSRCSQQITRSSLPEVLCNFIEITLWYQCSLVNFLYISRTAFPKSTSWGLLLNFHSLYDCAQIKSKVDLKSDFHLPKKFYLQKSFICFSKSPLKMMKNTFYFILQTFFVLKIFKFLSYILVM